MLKDEKDWPKVDIQDQTGKTMAHRKRSIDELTNALNAGLKETKGSVIAITDDDCTVPPKWLEKFASIFVTHPKVAVAFCSVEAGEHVKYGRDARGELLPDLQANVLLQLAIILLEHVGDRSLELPGVEKVLVEKDTLFVKRA